MFLVGNVENISDKYNSNVLKNVYLRGYRHKKLTIYRVKKLLGKI